MWLSKALECKEQQAKTEDGRTYYIENHSKIEDVYSSVVMGHLKCQHIRSYLMRSRDYETIGDTIK